MIPLKRLTLGLFAATSLSCSVGDPDDPVGEKLQPQLVVEKDVALILVNFTADPRTPVTVEQARQAFFESEDSVTAFYKEVSHDQLLIKGDVLGWYTIDGVTGCNEVAIADAAKELMIADSINFYSYDSLIFYFPEIDCGWGGYGIIPGTEAWLNGVLDGYLPAHEVGHTLSLHHASSTHCLDGGAPVPCSEDCSTRTYGDQFDTMGGGYRHFSVFQKSRLRWISDCGLLRVDTPGEYRIEPQQRRPSDNTVGLEVPLDEDRSFYVEHREPFGHFDDFEAGSDVTQGVLIRVAPRNSGDGESYLLDMHPETDTVEDAALRVGETFQYDHVTLTLQSIENGVATVNVAANVEEDPNYFCENTIGAPTDPAPSTGGTGNGDGTPPDGQAGGPSSNPGGDEDSGEKKGSSSSDSGGCSWTTPAPTATPFWLLAVFAIGFFARRRPKLS